MSCNDVMTGCTNTHMRETEMNHIFYLRAHDNAGGPKSRVSMRRPIWTNVEEWIERVFRYGGGLNLSVGRDAISGGREAFSLEQFLAMEAHPGECRLVYVPSDEPAAGKTKRCEWWEAGNAAFRGTIKFNDHEWDDRTVCRDQSVVVALFRDFFDHGDLSEFGLSQTRSAWDPKPR
jgi:hypothetical protein